MDALHRLAGLEFAILEIRKCPGDCGYLVSLGYVEIKRSIFLEGACGRGRTIQDAAEDYLNQISGNILVYKALPVAGVADRDCLLMMWATAPMLPQALDVMKAWGFAFKTMGAWAKQSKTGTKWAFGTGYILRSASEPFLIGTRGAPKVASRSERNLIVAPVREHSRKPDSARAALDRMIPTGRRLELFARESADGWETWGNQSQKFDRDDYQETCHG